MTLQIKMNMTENGVQASRSTGDAPLDSTTLDARAVAAFAGMMKQSSGKVNDSTANFTGSHAAPYDLAQGADVMDATNFDDLPSPAALASLASSLIASSSNGATTSASEHGVDDADALQIGQDAAPNAQMAALLASMNGALQASAMQNPVTPVVTEIKSVTAPHFTAKEIDAMVTMLVDRISVTDVKAHMVTVEVSLADTALRGTTVHLTRSLDGLLAVNVITNDAATFQTLVGAQIDLRTKLESLDSGMVRVDISHNPQDQEREQNRRSAMYQEYVGDDDHA